MRKITALLAVVAVIGCKEVSLMSGTEKDNPVAETSGRYQIVESRSDIFFIDTQRGRVWFLRPEMKVGKYDYEPHFWPITIIDDENKIGMDSFKWWDTPRKWEELLQKWQSEKQMEAEAAQARLRTQETAIKSNE
jgi:hypothetical protein